MMRETLDQETRGFLFNEARLQQFRDRLMSSGRKVVRQDAVWAAFADSYSDLPPGPERRLWLVAVLEELSHQGEIALPVPHGKQWDRTSTVAVPTAVTMASLDGGVANKSDWRNFPWHPRLHWVFGLRALMQDQVAFLKRVHFGLVAGWFEQPECLKYRSLQLTGDEKRLEELHRGILFGPERLTLEMLGCEPESLPLASEHFSDAPTLLIFENSAPFMLARRILAAAIRPAIGRLAYGAGKQVLKAVGYLPMVEPVITEIQYVGDLDAEGMSIATEFQRLSKAIPVRPATAFHKAMLESAIQLESPDGWPSRAEGESSGSASGVCFLVDEIREQVGDMICKGRRIPEEALSLAAMTRLLTARLKEVPE